LEVAGGGYYESLWASLGLKWQKWREAGFTEQRSLPASSGGRLTDRYLFFCLFFLLYPCPILIRRRVLFTRRSGDSCQVKD
jgi:hypothetical protein